MFNKKKDYRFDEEIKPQCPDPFKDKVKCETCKCWVDKKDAQEIKKWGQDFIQQELNFAQQVANSIII